MSWNLPKETGSFFNIFFCGLDWNPTDSLLDWMQRTYFLMQCCVYIWFIYIYIYIYIIYIFTYLHTYHNCLVIFMRIVEPQTDVAQNNYCFHFVHFDLHWFFIFFICFFIFESCFQNPWILLSVRNFFLIFWSKNVAKHKKSMEKVKKMMRNE